MLKNRFWGQNCEKISPAPESAPLKYLVCQFSSKMSNFHFFDTNLPIKEFWVWNFEKLSPDVELAPPKYLVCQISGKMDNFELFDPNLPKNEFWVRNFEKLIPDTESAPPRYHVCQLSGKTDNFEFFDPNFPKKDFGVGILKNYVRIQNQLIQDTMCVNFQAKRTTLNFRLQFGEIAQLRAIFWF